MCVIFCMCAYVKNLLRALLKKLFCTKKWNGTRAVK